MVGFAVQNHDVFQAHQIRHDALHHLAFGFESFEWFAGSALEQAAGAM
jgi:hypothetical protein